MSTLTNVVMTEFRARGGQVMAVMGQMGSATRAWTGSINENIRQSDRLNNQWRAIGTTIRYAIAGQAVFGLTRMVSQLKDVQTQLGLIQAIASQPPAPGSTSLMGGPLSTKQVDTLGRELQKVALRTMAPISEVNDAAVQLYSTVSNVPPDQVSPMLEAIAKAATLSTTGVDDLTGGLLALNIAFQRTNNPSNIRNVSQMWASMIALIPGGPARGAEIVKQLGPVSTQFMQAPGVGTSPEEAQAQMFALLTGSMRTGQTPSVAGRGLAFLAQAVATPRTPKQVKALAQFGITPDVVHEEGVYNAIVNHLLPQIKYGGNVKALAAIPEEQLSEDTDFAGLPPGQSQKLRDAIGMIHGVRSAIILSSQLQQHGNVQSLDQDFQIMMGNMDQHTRDVLELSKQWSRFSDRAKLKEASNALNLMGLQVAQVFEPVLNFAASQALTPLAKQMQKNPDIVSALVLGGTGIAAAYGGGRFLKGPGGLSRGIAGAQTLQSLGGAEADGSAMRPFFVIVQNQLYNPYGIGKGGPGGGGPGGPGGPVILGPGQKPPDLPDGKKPGKFGKYGKFGGALLGWQAALLTAYAFEGANINQAVLPGWLSQYSGTKGYGAAGHDINRLLGLSEAGQDISRAKKHAGWMGWSPSDLWGGGLPFDMPGGPGIGKQSRGPGAGGQRDRVALNSLQRAQAIWGKNVSGVSDPSITYGPGGINDATLTLNLNIKHPDGSITKKKVHTRYEVWQNNKAPSQGGKVAKSRR
jgi:hypothetical protein